MAGILVLKLGTGLSFLLALSYWKLLFSYIFKESESRVENFSFTLLIIRNWLRLPTPEQMLIGCSFHKSQTWPNTKCPNPAERQKKQKCYDRRRKLLSRLVARPPETKQEQLEASKNHYCLTRATARYCRNGEWMVLKESVRYTWITREISDSSLKWRKRWKWGKNKAHYMLFRRIIINTRSIEMTSTNCFYLRLPNLFISESWVS